MPVLAKTSKTDKPANPADSAAPAAAAGTGDTTETDAARAVAQAGAAMALAQASSPAALTLGQHVMVKAAPDALLRNNESGGFFAADTPTPQTVTVTLLRRLADGDLLLC